MHSRSLAIAVLSAVLLPGSSTAATPFAPLLMLGPCFADHGDTPALQSIGRHDARITDLHAFVRGSDLVLSLCTNPAIPMGLSSYQFPSDLTLEIAVDNNSPVTFNDANDLTIFGGTLTKPGRVFEDIVFRVTFDNQGNPKLRTTGLSPAAQNSIQLFAGLCDDPFIRGPRIGFNVAAVVIQIPLVHVIKNQSTLLLWATAQIPGVSGPFVELSGRSLRSMFLANDFMNTEHPRDHFKLHGVVPDVMIYDTSKPAAFPNGRELTDDVVDLVGEPSILANDAPFPSTNDVPFLTVFPYLAPPQ